MNDTDRQIIAAMTHPRDSQAALATELGITSPRLFQRMRQLAFDPEVAIAHPHECAEFQRQVYARRRLR